MSTGGNRRSWTEDDLRRAVIGEHSWRGVARALGLKSTSTNPIRRHAARLKLDTSHFTGQRPWSDADLRTAVSSATSWSGVLRILQVGDGNDIRTRLKAHAVRLKLDTSHLDHQSQPASADAFSLRVTEPDLSRLRRAAPSIAAVWFTLRGFAVSTPLEPEPYDLLVAMDGGLQRIQVKSSTTRAANGKWMVRIGRRPYSSRKPMGVCPYHPDALDYFFIVSGDGELYLFPSNVVAGQVGVQPESHPAYRVGDCSSLLS
jgi:PD-(D/E)XK endonuclease